MYILYRLNAGEKRTECFCNYKIVKFHPFPKLRFNGEKVGIKELLIRLFFNVISFGKVDIFMVIIDNLIVHKSYVVGKCWKFPFLNNDERVIGPCFTIENYRGRGIYPSVINYIVSLENNLNYYLIIHENNCPSIKGISKTPFREYKRIKKTRILKIYK